jgi:hypothetical protein
MYQIGVKAETYSTYTNLDLSLNLNFLVSCRLTEVNIFYLYMHTTH